METKIKFKDLSIPNKIAIIMAWSVGIIFILAFVIEYAVGILVN